MAVHKRSIQSIIPLISLWLLCFVHPAVAATTFTLSTDGVIRMLENVNCTGTTCRWVDIGRDRGNIALAASSDRLFLLRRDGSIWQWSGIRCEATTACAQWAEIGGSINAVAFAANDVDLFALRGSGALFRLVDACHAGQCERWQLIDRGGATAEITASGAKLFKRRRNGETHEWTGAACAGDGTCPGWRLIDNNPNTQEIAAGAPGNLYQRHRSGAVWRWKGGGCVGKSCPSWDLIASDSSARRLATARGALYQLHSSGAVKQFLGTACTPGGCPSWKLLDNNPQTRILAAAQDGNRQLLYQVRQAGAVLRLDASCTDAACASWLDQGSAFSRYTPDGSMIYAFESNVWAGAVSPTLQVEDFGFDGFNYGSSGPNKVKLNVLVLMSSYSNTSFDPGRTKEYYAREYFGPTNRLARYFNDNSRLKQFDIQLAGVERVFDRRTMNCAHRWSDCEAATDGQLHTWATVEQIGMLPPGAARRYARYDLDGNGRITPDELLVIKVEGMPDPGVIGPFNDNCGNTFSYPAEARLPGTTKRFAGRFIAVGDDTNFITIAHEVAHVFGALDIRGTNANTGFTTMCNTCADSNSMFHLDPWHKMRMGLVRPRIFPIPASRSARNTLRLTVPVNRAAYEPALLYRTENANEYFMLEYRRTGSGTFDNDVPANGLVIWHIFTDRNHMPLNYNNPMFNNVFPESGTVAVVGAPNQTIGRGRAWVITDGVISLNWPGRGDSGLRLRVVRQDPFYLTVEWWRE